jgi:hypothetical protein
MTLQLAVKEEDFAKMENEKQREIARLLRINNE